jgi:amino acid adenylation domain-containing protein
MVQPPSPNTDKDDVARHSSLVSILRERAVQQPDNPAYTFLIDGEEEGATLNYFEVDLRARAIGATLQRLGASNNPVLLVYPPGIDFMLAFYGCLYAGAIAVPTQPPGNGHKNSESLARFQAIIDDAKPLAVLSVSALTPKLKTLTINQGGVIPEHWVATDDLSVSLARHWRDPELEAEALSLFQYTSGSTSSPKGVMVSHRNLLANSEYIDYGFEHDSQSISLSWLPHSHDMGLINGIIQPLYKGFRSYLMSPAAFIQSPYRWLKAISRYRVTHSGGPNFAYELCVRKINAEQRAALDLSCWEIAFNGAEPVRKQTLVDFAEAFAPCGFHLNAFYPAYGLAEATLKVTGGRRAGGPVFIALDDAALERNSAIEISAAAEKGRSLVGAGSMACGTKVVIADPDSAVLCGPAEIGEVWVSGPGVARGYWNREEETESAFRAFLKDTGEGPFLRSGDLGFLKDGELFITGRIKDLIIIRGVNHYPQDIELSVERCHPSLRPGGGAAFSVEMGGREQLVVAQEIDVRRQPDLDEVIASIRRAVAENHELQAYAIALLKPGALPKTTSGKLQRRLCRSLFLEGGLDAISVWRAPDVEKADAFFAETSPPGTDESLTEWLRSLLASKIGIPAPSVDLDQPITRYGLDSLTAVELAHSVETGLGVTLPMTSFLESPSISQLAERLRLDLNRKDSSQDASASAAPEAEREDREVEEAPLSFGQHSLWFLHKLAPESAAYNISLPLLMKTELDLPALKRAFQSLVDRHASLRASFGVSNGEPFQRIHNRMEARFEVEDASQWSSELLSERLDEEAYRPFKLDSGRLFKVKVFIRSQGETVLLVTAHHIITDLWSLAVILRELGILYSAETRGLAAALPHCEFQYIDYVRWELRMLASPEGERLLSYWRRQLDGVSPVTNLPTDRPRPKIQTYRGAACAFNLDAEQTGQLKELSRESGATLYMTLLAAFQTLIHRYTGQQDLIVGSPAAGRDRAELAGLVGYLVNPIGLRADFSGSPTFRSFLDQVRRTVIEALEHSRYPFPLLVKQLQIERYADRSPLFQVFFAFQKAQIASESRITSLALGAKGARIKLGELDLESMSLEHRVAQFDLTLVMTEIDGELSGSFEYNADLFDRLTIERMTGHFQLLVKEILADHDKRVSLLQLLTESETRTILGQWNETSVNYGAFDNLHQLFELQVELTPDAVAVVYEDECLTYGELNRQANRLAYWLRSMGVEPDGRVCVLMERSIELVIGLLGVLKAGGAYLPLDPEYPPERLSFMIRDAGAKIVLTQERFTQNVIDLNLKTLCLDKEKDRAVIATEDTRDLPKQTAGDSLAYVIYTSGSTGEPKGAMNTHRGIINRLLWMQAAYGLTENDRVLQKTPYSFDVSVWEFFWPLITGAGLVMARPGGHRESEYLARLIAKQGITTLHFVPSMLQVFLEEPKLAECRSIRRVICSGEALTVELQDRFFARFDAELHNLYGPTEAAVDVTFWACERQSEKTSVPIGRPIANTQIYILDKETRPAPVAVTGALHIAGVGVARGYLNRPDMTAEKFVPSPFSREPGERMYETGDLARFLPDGAIEFLGRSDYQVKIRGFRIELGEIERALAAHPAVREVVVVARETGTRDKAIVAYLSPAQENQNSALSGSDLRKYLQAKLPEYMIPSAYVLLEMMPLTPNGKLDRRALPPPEYESEREYLAPRTEIERGLAAVFSEVLGREKVGVNDNFFELGGHSLLATQALTRIIEKFNVEVPFRQLFEAPTVGGLAEAVSELLAGGGERVNPITRISRPIDETLLADLDQLTDQEVEALLVDYTVQGEEGNGRRS